MSDNNGISITLTELIRLRLSAQQIDIFSKRKVATEMSGAFMSGFRGRGVDFSEVRMYQAGDDIRNMDWRVTARTGKPHTKLYREEKERPVYILVDYSPPMFFGTKVCFKSVIAAKLASIIAWAAVNNGDRLGGLIYSGNKQTIIRPRVRQQGVLSFLNLLADKTKPEGEPDEMALNNALVNLRRVIRPGSMLFLLSDFYGIESAEQQLKQISQHNDVFACFVYDALEKEPPPANRYAFSNGEKIITLNTGSKVVCQAYRHQFQQRFQKLKEVMHQSQVPVLEFSTQNDVVHSLQRYFSLRKQKVRA